MENQFKLALAKKRWENFAATPTTTEGREIGNLEVNVVFTDSQGSLAALKTAGALAHDLGTSTNLVAPQAVPYALDLDQPQISVDFTEQLLSDLVSQAVQGHLETNVRICLCRNRLETVLQVLKPNSLLVVGGGKRWWPTQEGLLARRLRSKGHQVVFVGPR
jgi:hypothetical protein